MAALAFPVGLPALWTLGVGFVLFLATMLVANHRTGKRQTGGRRNMKSILPIAVQGLAIAIAAFGPIHVDLASGSEGAILQAVAVGVFMAGTIGLFAASSHAMGRNWAVVAQTRSDHELVTSGPFAWVRNPIYDALFLFLVAMGIGYGHYWNIVVATPLYWIGTMMRVRMEEKLLRAQFGSAYEAYTARVKRFMPGLI